MVVVLAVASAIVFSTVGTASAATSKLNTIYISAGVYRARLGTTDGTAQTRVGLHLAKSGKDNNYQGQVVYYHFFGKKRAGGYDVEMYSNKSRIVWLFAIFGSTLKTTKGIHVGSTEAALKHAYGRALSKSVGDIYTTYWLGTRAHKGTDFYVRNSTHKITEIDVRNW